MTSFGLATLQHASAAVVGVLFARLHLTHQSPQVQSSGISSPPAELPQSGLKAVCMAKIKRVLHDCKYSPDGDALGLQSIQHLGVAERVAAVVAAAGAAGAMASGPESLLHALVCAWNMHSAPSSVHDCKGCTDNGAAHIYIL